MLKVQQRVTADRIPKKKPYICDICYKQFETPSKLARHFLIHTGQKPFECHLCHKTFRQLVHLERHQLTHNLPFKCVVCYRNFKNLITFLKHQELHNENCQNDTKQAESSVKSEQDRVTSGTFQCSACWKSFATEERWMLHQCLKGDHLHGARRRKKTHACESCKKTFPSRSKLARHFLIHTGQKPYKCSLCGKCFRQSTHLKIHQLTHTEERPFQCCFCQKGFKIQSKLIKHKQLHARNKTFPNIAHRAKSLKYPRPYSLAEGKRSSFENADACELRENDPHDVHTIYIVPFQCPVCEQCFETEQVLNLHKCYLKDGKGSNSGATACSQAGSMKNKVLMKLKHTGGRATDFSLSGRKSTKSGHFKSPDLVATKDQRSDQHASTKPLKDSCSKLDMCKVLGNRMKRTFAVPLPWQEHPQPSDLGIHLKGMLAGESMLTTHDSLDNKGDALYGSSDGRLFDKPEVLRCVFSASAKNRHGRHKVCKCDRCEKSFPSSSKLQRHYLTHTGQKPFGCNICGKAFRQSAHLKRHQLTHNGKRPYKSPARRVECENLNRLLNQQGDHIEFKPSLSPQTPSQPPSFQEFELVESNQTAEIKVEIKTEDFVIDTSSRDTQPYLCGKLVEEEQSHSTYLHEFSEGTKKSVIGSKFYQCSICYKAFKSPSKLERHYLMHAGQKPFPCLVCGKNFRQAPHLKRHHLIHSRESLKLSSTEQKPENILGLSKVDNGL
ncbi:zinc finger protein 770 [Dryobates pubescens]|uniref:zinc finger protein 770 n=1 Tax=Dryobates pubescens TaxID=118200 RepID=UPI0023B9C32E|nr:zinc finger protein 770 [Dryobates pubescens]XP_054018087.1 zinc finger protein 770 [Dryobates pubescens]XP_054018088.1 zinc finger protein 770 [Dryobates pubescens]XP_054018089.1 zinc finger protein 770 [Dryobates pubescens]